MARARNKRNKTGKKRARTVVKKRNVSHGANLIVRLIPFALAAALIGLGIKAGLTLFFDSDYFRVKTIELSGEGEYSGLRSLASEMNAKKGINIFGIDLKRNESYIENNYPDLKDVKVRRILPDTIGVSFKVRKPCCQVDSGKFYLVSDDMVVLPDQKSFADPNLVIITGINIDERKLLPSRRSHSEALKKAISLLKEIESSGFSGKHKVVNINIYDKHNPAIFLEDGTRIEIGEYSFKQRYNLLKGILDDLESKGRGAKVIDLRFEDAVVIPR
ncbi:MAG: cell division protein FtsQ/DivIB [Candidatus Omnitrophota bacterium]